ncbi:MAG: thioredoxin domain-containing protein, partial [Patescibacteria group bacterium]
NQQSWSDSNNVRTVFEGYAEQLGLDTKKFKTDFASSETNDRINADRKEFTKTGFQESTPTFILNGKRIQPASLEEFSKLIEEALKKQD